MALIETRVPKLASLDVSSKQRVCDNSTPSLAIPLKMPIQSVGMNRKPCLLAIGPSPPSVSGLGACPQSRAFFAVLSHSGEQEEFVKAVEDRLRAEGLVPQTIGRTAFSSDTPLKAVTELMDKCSDLLVIAFERCYFSSGAEKRGGVNEKTLADVKVSAPWNQIEAAKACSRPGRPVPRWVRVNLSGRGPMLRTALPGAALPVAARTRGRARALLMALGIALAGFPIAWRPAVACTRVLYTAPDGTVITGRSMDWSEDMRSNLWAFPRGIDRDGGGGARTPRWRSRFGSVVVSGYDLGSAEGMNEKGLVANLLYLAESEYGKPDGRPVLSISLWAQYVLDQFGTVAEAVAHLREEPFRVVAPTLPNGQGAQLHLAISDATGDSAIFEYIGGRLVIHHGRQYTVMTNSPSFDQQLALNSYWQTVGGSSFLPGTIRAADRFVRASFLLAALPRQADPAFISAVHNQSFPLQALAGVLGVVRSVGVPLGISTPGAPNLSSTIWRVVNDQKRRVLYFDAVTTPSLFWVSLDQLDFSVGAPVRRLPVAGGRIYGGETASRFEPSPAFPFLPADGLPLAPQRSMAPSMRR